MISLLSKLFIKNSENVGDPGVRQAYGTLCGMVGIALNLLLFAGKYFAGTVSGSIAIIADSFNNLSDAGSSLITLLGFRLAGKKPDPTHPYGHGRVEYISGLVVAGLILMMGVNLGRDAISAIRDPQPLETGWLPAIILAVSICVKVYMFLYNRAVGKKISSAAMVATASDSLSDSVSTAVVLISMLIARFSGLNIDGYAGALVALFILYTGYGAARDTLAPLLGQAPDPEFVRAISERVMSHPEVKGIHDLIVHDYGPGRQMISLHTEVDGKDDIFEIHDAIDNIERELMDTFGCHATIHMDPIETDNAQLSAMRKEISALVKTLDPSVSIHDFRMVPGTTHTSVIFDVVVPHGFRMTDEEVAAAVKKMVSDAYPNHFAVLNIDKAYV